METLSIVVSDMFFFSFESVSNIYTPSHWVYSVQITFTFVLLASAFELN